jgi:NADH-quinone oxidoreductase subunit L
MLQPWLLQGIYLVARMGGLFNLAPFTLSIITITGLATAFVAATIALKQNDIKKVLAYSTVSQLGYMVVALGCAAYGTAIFHVMTHAFFKALLFLSAGSVIHGLHGEQDITNMGGLKSSMKWTHLVFLIGTLALVGCPPLAGFFSKDEILAVVYSHSLWYFVILAFTSVFTAWYMFRIYFATFHGSYRGDPHTASKIHESPAIMVVPLVVLAVLSVIGGFAGIPEILFPKHYVTEFLSPVLKSEGHHVSHFFEYCLWGITVLALLVIGYFTLRRYGTSDKTVFNKTPNSITSILKEKYYLDELYYFVFVAPLKSMGSFFKNVVDRVGIDSVVRFPDNLFRNASIGLKPLNSGIISWYVISMVLGLLCFLLLFMI